MRHIYVIGIDGAGAFGKTAAEALERAGVIISSKRLNELLGDSDAYAKFKDKCKTIDNVDKILDFMRDYNGVCVVLASGDPMFYGIGIKINETFPDDDVVVVPAVSCVQLAFSKTNLSWHDAFFVSFHGNVKRQWTPEDLPMLAALHPKLVALTGGENTPPSLAALLPDRSRIFVCERLGYPDEAVTIGSPSQITAGKFADPNLMIILTEPDEAPVFGLGENAFEHEAGLITKDEVRAVALHSLKLPGRGVLWDVGAGSGSVSIEAKRLCPALEVFAIEKKLSRVHQIKKNMERLNARNLHVICAEAPGALDDLPAPDRVFVGGSGSALAEVIKKSFHRMEHGVIVVNAVTIESLNEAVNTFKSIALKHTVTLLCVSRTAPAGERQYLQAVNPVYIIKAEK